MPLDWTLARSKVEDSRTLNAWGIRTAKLDRINSGRDTLTLGFARVDLTGNLPFDPDETIVLRRDGDPYFIGRVTGENRGAFGSAEGVTLTLSGPWWYLEKLIYQQSAGFVLEPTANPDPENPAGLQITDFELVERFTSIVRTGLDGTGARLNVQEQITAILNYAIAKGAPIAIGTIDPVIAGPRQEFRDINCAELLVRLLAFTPGCSIFWDYTVDPPALHIRSRLNRELFTLDIADETTAEVELNPRRDLVVSGVTVNYLRLHRRPNFQFYTLDKESIGANPEGIGALVLTLGVNGTYIIEGDEDDIIPQEDAPIGIAAAIYSEYSIAPFEGRVSLLKAESDDPISWLSRTLNILNAAAAWATASMTIQRSSENLFPLDHADGTFFEIELTIGPPNQLGPTNQTTRLAGSTPTPPGDPNVPTTPPVPGNFPPYTPPTPEPPHTDYDPMLYAVSNKRFSGSVDSTTGSLPMPPSSPTLTLGPDPPFDHEEDDLSGLSGSIGKSARRTANSGATQYEETKNAAGHYTSTVFNLALLPPSTVAVRLIGEKTISRAAGDIGGQFNETVPVQVDLAYVHGAGGLVTHETRAALGAIWNHDDSISFQVASASGSIVFTILRAFGGA